MDWRDIPNPSFRELVSQTDFDSSAASGSPGYPVTAVSETCPEPVDGSIVIFVHPTQGAPEDAWWRYDASAEEGGYGDQHWYPLGRMHEDPPKSWYELTEEHDAEARLFVVTAMEEVR